MSLEDLLVEGWPRKVFAGLRRWPDVEAENLQAHDSADELLLETASAEYAERLDGPVAVLGDHYGALAVGLAAAGVPVVRASQDALSGEQAIRANAASAGLTKHVSVSDPATAVDGVRLVLVQLPRSLDVLREWARVIAERAADDVVVLAGGRVKHMALAMNEALGSHFTSVTAGLARRKARVLTAFGPTGTGEAEIHRNRVDVGLTAPLELRAVPGAFGGAKLDPGTRLLLPELLHPEHGLPAFLPTNMSQDDDGATAEVIDLGCGNGTIAAFVAKALPRVRVLACDQSAAAIASTLLTAEANGVSERVATRRDDAVSQVPDGAARAIVLNPPFHMGNTVHAGIAVKLFADAARALAPGGRLWCVWNSHLMYRPQFERIVGPTQQLARNAKFTVTVSTRRG